MLLVVLDSPTQKGNWKFSHKVSFTCSPSEEALNDAAPEDAAPEDEPHEPTEKEKQELEQVQNMSIMMAEIDRKANEDEAKEEAEQLATNADVAVERQLAAKMLNDASWIPNGHAAKQAREKGEQVAKEGALRVSKEVEKEAAEAERKAEAGRQARQHAEQNTSWFQAPTRKVVTRAKPRNKTAVGAKPGWFNS